MDSEKEGEKMNNQTLRKLQKSKAQRSNRTTKVTNWFGQKEMMRYERDEKKPYQLNCNFVDYGRH